MSWKQIKIWKSIKVLNKASQAQQNLENQQANLAGTQTQFYQQLMQSYQQQFANQNAILSSITSAFNPILQAGIGQYGFTPQEDMSMRTQASDTIAQGLSSAQTALNENLAARGGGNTFTPSGATGQLEASLLGSANVQQSNAMNQITQAGYATGRSNFLAAQGALSGAAGMYSPLGYAGAATSAGGAASGTLGSAFGMATNINNENNAWLGALGGAVGGLAGSFLGPIGSTLGQDVGNAIGNIGNSSPGGYTPYGPYATPENTTQEEG